VCHAVTLFHALSRSACSCAGTPVTTGTVPPSALRSRSLTWFGRVFLAAAMQRRRSGGGSSARAWAAWTRWPTRRRTVRRRLCAMARRWLCTRSIRRTRQRRRRRRRWRRAQRARRVARRDGSRSAAAAPCATARSRASTSTGRSTRRRAAPRVAAAAVRSVSWGRDVFIESKV